MALFRALETVRRGRPPRLFRDPHARLFLSPGLRIALGLARVPLAGRLVPWFIDRRWPGARTSGVARTRLIDEAVLAGVREGARQLVLLGAGFDCRALRLPALAGVRVFEVDRAATLARKQALLARANARPTAAVVPVAIDFDSESLPDALARAGFEPGVRTFFVWEGVTNYLTAAAVDDVLAFVARGSAPGTRILFTYVHRGAIDGSAELAGTAALRRTLARVREPWTFGLVPEEIDGFLAERGLERVEDVGADEYRARGFGPAADGMRGYEFYRAVLARVPERDGARPSAGGAGPRPVAR